MTKKLVVIGAGPAGIMAAGKAAELGSEVLLLEKNSVLGKKLSISGKGRCNVTNIGDIREFIASFSDNGPFLYSSLQSFNNLMLIELLRELGVETKVERGGRVFPMSDKASEIVDALKRYLIKNNVEINLSEAVQKIIIEKNRVYGVLTDKRMIKADRVILCTGGKSYPGTGSTGDGYKWAQEAGHTIVKIRPSLVPLNISEDWVKSLQGLSLKNVEVTLYEGKKKVHKEFGEMLFTHFGVSGPVILTISRIVTNKQSQPELFEIGINLKPALNEAELEKRIQRDFLKYQKKQIKNALNDLLPSKMIDVIIEQSAIEPEKYVHQLTKNERKIIRQKLTDLRLTVEGPRPLKEAIITAGGVSLKEVDPKTMESKIVRGLFFAGEILDIDAHTGGYNLQAAFSTGCAAGIAAALR